MYRHSSQTAKNYQWNERVSPVSIGILNTNNWIVSLKLYKCSRILPYCLSSAAIAQLSQPKTWLRLMGSFLAIDSVMSVCLNHESAIKNEPILVCAPLES